MSRRRKAVIAICLVAAAFGGAGLWALPEVVRRVAVQKIPELTGRATSIEDIDLSLFTGRFAVKKLRLERRPGHGPEAFVEFDRLDGRIALLALLRSDVRLVDLRLSRPTVRITRTEPFGFDFSDLLALFVKPVGNDQPSRWTFSLAHLSVSGGTVVVGDAVPSPPQQWRLEELDIGAATLTTRPNRPAGQLRLAGRLGETKLSVTSESVQLTPLNIGLDVSLRGFDVVRLRPYLPADLPAAPLSGKVDLVLHLDRVRAGEALAESSLSGEVRVRELSLVPRDRAAVFLRLDRLAVAIKRMDFLARDVVLSGIDVEGLDVKAERSKSGQIDVLDLIAPRRVAAAPAGPGGAAEADGRSATVGAETPADPRGPSPEGKVARVRIERLGLRAATLTLVDAAVAPAREWKIAGLTVDAASISSAGEDAPGTLRVEGQLETRPGSSKPASVVVDADAMRLSPPSVSASVTLTGFDLSALEPYWPQTLPATARQGSVGFTLKFGLERTEAGLARAVASGSARVQGVTVARRGSAAPFLTIPRLAVEIKQADAVARQLALGTVEIAGVALRAVRDAGGQIDLLGLVPAGEPGPAVANQLGADSGAVTTAPSPAAPSNPPPGIVTVDRLIVRSARIALADEAVSPTREWQIEGMNVDLRTLFTPRKSETSGGTREAAAPAENAARSEPLKEGGEGETATSGGEGGLLQSIVIDFAEIEVENGGGKFIDHTTTPAFSENITRLALTIKNLSNVLGRPERTTLSAQALVGVDGALDIRGDLSGIGETLRADLVAELRAFSLPATNPYSESLTSWIVQRGTLEAKLHYHVEGDRITAEHDLEFKKLRVEKSAASDEAKRRIGVPLGLAVALLRDSNGDIDFKLPLTGTLSDKNFDWGETGWAGVKQVIAKVLLSPFRAVGRLFKGSDDTVDKLEIDPVTFPPGSAVVAPSIEAQLTHLADFLGRSPGIKLALASVLTAADVQRVKEQQVSARLEALRREQRLPDLASAIRADYQQQVLDVPLPGTTTDQMALLVSREPVPEAQLAELARRRLEATRDDLVKARGIAEARVMVTAPSSAPAPSASGQGRVEFTIVPADE